MQKISKEARLKNIVCKGLEYLQDHFDYGQRNVVNKLKMLEMPVGTASFSNIVTGKAVGLPTLNLAARGVELILQRELDMAYDANVQDFRPKHTPGWEVSIVPEKEPDESGRGFVLHVDGRVSLQYKTAFMATAQKDIVEVGVRLNSFSSYFISQNENAYKMHILGLLRRGIHIKEYLLDPDSQEARIYFDDRARVQTSEKDSLSEMKKVVERLKTLGAEFEAMKLTGKFEVYLYRHIPYSLFYVVDGTCENGKMMVSHYMYGVRRANCPVMEVTRAGQPVLFRKYWESMQLFLEGAHKISW